jgi:hypothetical protein
VVFWAIKAFISLIALIKQIVNQIREDDDPEPGFDGYFLPEWALNDLSCRELPLRYY